MSGWLITGATGFFGRGLICDLLTSTGASRICIFSRDEAKQAAMRASIADPHGRLRWFVGDVRDERRLRRAMQDIQVVIHAAALKRVEVGESNPDEMVKTNVLGTMNVLSAAFDAGVQKVVALSTDKACAPLNAYGASKLLMEKLVLGANNSRGATGPMCAVTRYGNVANSTGSVIPTWRCLIEQGSKTVPVTDPACTRFWMTLQEAIDLVLWTVDNMQGGELVVPILPAFAIGTLAQAMGAEMDIKGITPGEKDDEVMVAPYESPGFRLYQGKLIKGGLAKNMQPNLDGVRTGMLTVENLRERLAQL